MERRGDAKERLSPQLLTQSQSRPCLLCRFIACRLASSAQITLTGPTADFKATVCEQFTSTSFADLLQRI